MRTDSDGSAIQLGIATPNVVIPDLFNLRYIATPVRLNTFKHFQFVLFTRLLWRGSTSIAQIWVSCRWRTRVARVPSVPTGKPAY